MKTWLLLLFFILAYSPMYGTGNRQGVSHVSSDPPDTAYVVESQDSPKPLRPLRVDLTLGRQFSGNAWSPYEQQTSIAASIQFKSAWFPVWADAALAVAWSGETDADGHRAGPGTSFVELHGGAGQWWDLERSQISLYAGGGFNYTWAKLELPDMSKPPLPASEFVGHPIYPDMDQSGNFWGGYLRAGVACNVSSEFYIGIGGTVTLTTNRNILGRNANASSALIGLFAGARQ